MQDNQDWTQVWRRLAAAVERGRVHTIRTSKAVMVQGAKEDLRKVWEATVLWWRVRKAYGRRQIFWMSSEVIREDRMEDGWKEVLELAGNDGE